ncbi:hypothetical protein Cgig2_000694 [Carnegiea gigantea]|uniref:Uncharacterized protein n=1 Tax=Carnegiea gigantea TaxID=171969 RepID=A0A9Q1QGM5_9CARY|nr:hypothetical protein Cgig2_000694 [Carnegiea gigantea]
MLGLKYFVYTHVHTHKSLLIPSFDPCLFLVVVCSPLSILRSFLLLNAPPPRSALLSCSGLPINMPTLKICLGRSEIPAFEHSIQTMLDPLTAVFRSAYRKLISGIQKTRWCICPAMQQLKQHKSTLPKFFRFEVSTFMCEKGIKTSDNPKVYYRHLLCSSNLQVIHPLEPQILVLCSHICVLLSDPNTGNFIFPKYFL